MPPLFKLLLILVPFALASCATSPSAPPVDDISSQAPITRQTEPQAAEPTPADRPAEATQMLLAQAQTASNAADHGTAVVYLERAVRLDPRNATLWTQLAKEHLAQGDLPAATQHARKAIALAGNTYALERAAWLVYASIQEASGRQAEAKSIRRRYSRIRG